MRLVVRYLYEIPFCLFDGIKYYDSNTFESISIAKDVGV